MGARCRSPPATWPGRRRTPSAWPHCRATATTNTRRWPAASRSTRWPGTWIGAVDRGRRFPGLLGAGRTASRLHPGAGNLRSRPRTRAAGQRCRARQWRAVTEELLAARPATARRRDRLGAGAGRPVPARPRGPGHGGERLTAGLDDPLWRAWNTRLWFPVVRGGLGGGCRAGRPSVGARPGDGRGGGESENPVASAVVRGPGCWPGRARRRRRTPPTSSNCSAAGTSAIGASGSRIRARRTPRTASLVDLDGVGRDRTDRRAVELVRCRTMTPWTCPRLLIASDHVDRHHVIGSGRNEPLPRCRSAR